MRFRPEWLRRVLHVPYVPTLGPVHPDTLDVEVFDDVIAATLTGVMLPFDKDRRWSSRKSEIVLVEEIVHRPDLTIVPTVSRRGHGMIKVHVYSSTRPDTDALVTATRRWCAAYGAGTGRIIWFHQDAATAVSAQLEQASTIRLLLKIFGGPAAGRARAPSAVVADLDTTNQQVGGTFADFADELADAGFGFLHRRWREGAVDGPILVAVLDERVIGAIGPLATMTDRQGAAVMLPQYFAVLPAYRGRGYGRSLWRHAVAWGDQHQAAYQLLQTATGGPSEQLFRSEGLTTLGFVTAAPA
jgi:GNAT superfamily N-acetyltransferase